jgi:hypothetical protein
LVMKGKWMQSLRAPADEFGVLLPGVPPLVAGAAEPGVWAEGFVMSWVSAPAGGFPAGVEYVRGAYVGDPRGERWLRLSGAAYIGKGIGLGYRITVQHA